MVTFGVAQKDIFSQATSVALLPMVMLSGLTLKKNALAASDFDLQLNATMLSLTHIHISIPHFNF